MTEDEQQGMRMVSDGLGKQSMLPVRTRYLVENMKKKIFLVEVARF